MDVTRETTDSPTPLSRGREIRREKEEKDREVPHLSSQDLQSLKTIVEEALAAKISESNQLSELRSNALLDEVSRLKTSINRVLDHIQSVQLGEVEDAALRVTTDKDASDIALAHVNLNSEDYYKYTTSEIASQLNIRPYDAQQIIKKSGIKNQPVFHQEIKVGKTSRVHKYSDEALDFLKKFLKEERYIIPEHRKL